MPFDMPPVFVASNPPHGVPAKMTHAIGAKAESSQVPYKRLKVVYLPNEKVHIPFLKYMRLPTPGWWVTVPGFSSPPRGFEYEFTTREGDDGDANLEIASAARRSGADDPIIEILQKPPHVLTQAERDLLEPKMPDSKKSYTQSFSGKTALVEEFVLNGKQFYQMQFNSNSNSSKVMVPASIEFGAKPSTYKLYIKRVKASLDTIKWNDIALSGED
ncbi:MAG: hypothetical protein IPP97_26620 [Candidatus Obscuribacter sp.]|nr:hypothetical protein [Candidatus Obscuribacter sp.]MBP6348475.1 hypothetical protein [Candidatus Obscuribacter sp.]MBP6594265.1 hypothetical protein [Candidatus Obscuribacter sp.]MBP7575280.1 hypothetical protein [Candidatus Obscuribacter sp.]